MDYPKSRASELGLYNGKFTSGIPGLRPASVDDAAFMNELVDSILAVQAAAGQVNAEGDVNQLLNGIRALIQKQVILDDTGAAANTYAAANTIPLTTETLSRGREQRIVIAHSNTGASTYAPDGLTAKKILSIDMRPLKGGELLAGSIATLSYSPNADGNVGAWVLQSCNGVPPSSPNITGTARNAWMNIGAGSTTGSFAADEIVLAAAIGGAHYNLGNFNAAFNLATVGIGGMDAGAPPANGFLALYAAYNPITSESGVFWQNASSSKVPEVYGGANRPSGYTVTALCSVWPTDANGKLVAGYQRARNISITRKTVLTTSVPAPSITPISIASAVPLNAVSVTGDFQVLASNSADSAGASVACSPLALQAVNASGLYNVQPPFFDMPIITNRTLYYGATVSGSSSMTAILNICGYSF